MLLLIFILLIAVTFSTPTPVNNNYVWYDGVWQRKVLLVKAIGTTTLILVIVGFAFARSEPASQFLSVTFAVDGKPVSCPDLKVTLWFLGQQIVPKLSTQGFAVPAIFREYSESRDYNVRVTVACGELALEFSDVHPSLVAPGRWEFGIAYPPYWFKPFRSTSAVEHGTWVSYLLSECHDCDPGVYTTVNHENAPQRIVMDLIHEQPDASGERARDIAYSLAVFGADYQRNRDYLLKLLNVCLSRPKESAEDNVCDGDLLDYITNLYWRGDAGLLMPLLQVAGDSSDVISEIGYFYGDLLDRHTAVTVDGLRKLAPSQQTIICKLAGKDEYSLDEPKVERVTERLHKIANETANQCLRVAKQAANDVPWRHNKN